MEIPEAKGELDEDDGNQSELEWSGINGKQSNLHPPPAKWLHKWFAGS